MFVLAYVLAHPAAVLFVIKPATGTGDDFRNLPWDPDVEAGLVKQFAG